MYLLKMTLFISVLIIFTCAIFATCKNAVPASGFYTDDIEKVLGKYEIVYPEKVSKDGSFVSYYLPHYYNLDSLENRPRRTPGQKNWKNGDEIHFFVPIAGEKQHLELWPNWNFLSSGLVVERRDARDVQNINKAKISHISQKQCHYSGEIVGKPNSSVALSTCYGLAGFIRDPAGDEYLIEPLKDTKPTKGKEHAHIIYKRSGKKDSHGVSNCLTRGKAKDALAERHQWESLFGDQVRRDLSGLNINDLVVDSSKNSHQHPHMNEFSDNELFNGNLPQVGKSAGRHGFPQPGDKAYNTNSMQSDNANQINDFQQMPSSQNTMDNSLNSFGTSLHNEGLSSGNQMKHKAMKFESNMVNINLPDVDNSPVKSIPNMLVNDYSDRVDETAGNAKSHYKSMYFPEQEHKRIKRELENLENVNSNFKNKVNTDEKIKAKQFQSKPVIQEDDIIKNNQFQHLPSDESKSKRVCHSSQNLVHSNENMLKDEGSARNVPEMGKVNNFEVPEKSFELKSNEQKLKSKIDNLSSDKIKFEKREFGFPKEKSTKFGLGEIKREMLSIDQFNNGVKTQSIKNDYGCKGSLANDVPISKGKFKTSEQIIDGKTAYEKRDIHLDTSEKSWQVNNNELKEKQDKASKACNNKESNDKISETMEKSLTNLLKNLENSSGECSKSCEVSEDSQKTSDKKIVTNLNEPSSDYDNKGKVKKEISFSLNNDEAKHNMENENTILSKTSLNHDNSKYINLEQIPLIDSGNSNENHGVLKVADDKQNLAFINQASSSRQTDKEQHSDPSMFVENKENSASLSKGPCRKEEVNKYKELEVNGPKETISNGETIIIKIKAPEGTVSEIEQSKTDNGKVENSEPLSGANAKTSEFKYDNSLNSLKSLDKQVPADISKRGLTNSLDSDVDKQKYGTENKSVLKSETINLNIQKQGITNTDNFQNKIKIKRGSPEQAMANAEKVNPTPKKEDLFCKGESCLDIRPIIFNTTGSITSNEKSNNSKNSSSNSNSTSSREESAKSKMVEKRQAWDECSSETTEMPLLCFDFFNKMFNLELMVTVDYKVLQMHEDDDIENFMLTILNMVSTNFYDRTIGINLSVFLVRMIILTTCIKELDSDRFNPEELLENFCTWQSLINPGKDDHPHHHDLAIFVTRMDKCEGQMLGVTYMTSVCRPDRACLVCVDEGLLLANTITHQIGHALGADHDESESAGCSGCTPDGRSFHMSPTITETSSAWSVCSRDSIIQFVKTQGSWCLSDYPVERQYRFPLMLPGQIYSAAQQCKLNFHMTTVPCSIGAFCEKLYCQVTEKLCATKGDPPADGTFCAANMWCFHKECVHVGRRPGAVNGEWGLWTEWSLCTRSCGGGVSTSYRICNNPKPDNGGRYCVGERIRHRMCAIKPCLGFTESFRDLQCKKTEDRPFRGRYHNWMQYQSHFLNIECALVCQNRKGDVVMRSPIVADGTPCKPGTQNVCIQGLCRNVGCDWVIESNAREDACGVCRGNGTECRIIQGVFTEETYGKGVVEFLRIPKGSGMIFIREIAPSANVIVVSGAINKVFYLNGQGSEDSMPGDVAFGNAHGVYEVRSGMERIFVRGPVTEELVVYLRFREQNKGVHYQFAVPEVDPTYSPRYLWQYLDWDPCTDPCSGGSQVTNYLSDFKHKFKI